MFSAVLLGTRPFWRVRAYYFLFYAAMACLLPFLSLYYQSLGMDGRQIGLLAGLPAIITVFSTPLWTGLADAQRRHRLFFLIASFSTLLLVQALGQARSFEWLLGIVLFYAFFYSPVMPLVDNSVMAMLGELRSRYGSLRMWGAVGWGLLATVMGWATESAGLRLSFWGFGLLFLGALLVGQALPLDMGHAGEPFWHGMKSLLLNRRLLLFLALVFAGGMAQTTVNSFLFLYMQDLHASKTLMGLALTVSTLSEIPLLFFADRFLHRFGARGMLVMSMLAYLLRLLLYGVNTNAWLVLPIQLLHGFTFSAMWVAGVSYASEIAPPGLGATTQGLFATTMFGFSAGLGAFLAGLMYQGWGGRVMYLGFAGFVAFSLLLYWGVDKLLSRTWFRVVRWR